MSWDSAGVRLPLVFSARMASMSMLWRAPMRSTLGCSPGSSGAAELHHGGHVDGLDDLLEGHGGRMVHAGIGGADSSVEALGCLLVGGVGLGHFIGGGRWREFGTSGRLGGGGRRRGGGGGGRFEFERGLGRGSGFAGFALGRWVGVGARSAVEGKLAAIGNDEGLILFGHGHTLSWFQMSGFWCGRRNSDWVGQRNGRGRASGVFEG